MKETIEARVTHEFQASPEVVYDAWLDPESVRIWLAAALRDMGVSGDIRSIEIDPRVGGRFHFSDQRGDVEARHWGTYLTLERPHRIVFTWIVDPAEEADPSRVTVTLKAVGSGCVATLIHEMDAQWLDYLSRTEQGWSRLLRAAGMYAENSAIGDPDSNRLR